ncbi:MAG: glycine/sarcosine/betaine reductase selenoprotein B family protein [Thermodesulfobacteriota bacterium]
MTDENNVVNGFLFLPPALGAWIKSTIPEDEFKGEIPWAPLIKPLAETTFALMTSAGINMHDDPPFDMERERREPIWGDPSYRRIPVIATPADIDVNHLHVNTSYIKKDINVALPINRFQELSADNTIGALAPTAYSYYGYQMDPTVLINETMPQVVADMKAEGVDAVLITPT